MKKTIKKIAPYSLLLSLATVTLCYFWVVTQSLVPKQVDSPTVISINVEQSVLDLNSDQPDLNDLHPHANTNIALPAYFSSIITFTAPTFLAVLTNPQQARAPPLS